MLRVNLSRIEEAQECRFTFHETEMLASDLARVLQSEITDVPARDSTAKAVARTKTTQFSGTILLFDNRPCAAIGYVMEPTGTLVVSEPIVFLDASDEVHRALCGQLIGRVKRRAVSFACQRLHMLLPVSAGAAGFERLQAEHGFVHVTDIDQWDLSVALNDQCSLQDQCTFQLYDSATNAAAATRELQFAIDAILDCSEDQSSQPQPTSAELLIKWQRLQANVFVYRIEQEIAGLMSCVTSPDITETQAVASGTLPLSTNVCIEYIGVVPAFRRRQIASRMIRQIPKLLSSICAPRSRFSPSLDTGLDPAFLCAGETELPDQGVDPDRFSGIESQMLRVTAYADAANPPASGLYRRCGFVQTTRLHLWCCDLAGNGRS